MKTSHSAGRSVRYNQWQEAMTAGEGREKKFNWKKIHLCRFERLSQPLPDSGKGRALVSSHFYDEKCFLILTNENTCESESF